LATSALSLKAIDAYYGDSHVLADVSFELGEARAKEPGSEEYLDSEKYQLRPRNWEKAEADGRSLAPYLTRLNEVRRAHPALHELRTTPGGLIDVTAPGKRDHDGVRCHTARMLLPPGDRTTIQGLPVTSLERTYLDYAEVATPRQLDEALTQGERSERLNFLRLKATLQRTPGRRGAKVLARALERHTPDDPRLRSKLEKLALARIRAAGLPEPQCNVYVDGILVDFYWPEADLVVEIDSYTFHGGKPSFEQDRRRDTIHTLAGRRTLRPTAHRIEHEPDAVISEISRLLSVAGARTGQ